MAVTIVSGNRGVFTHKVAGTTWAIGSPSGTLSTGNYALLAIVIDNPGTQEGATENVFITDSNNNTWTRLREQTEANTAAGTGVTCALFLSSRLTENLTTSDTLSASFNSQSVTAKGAGLAELSVAAGKKLVLSGANGTNAAGSTAYSVALSSLRSIAGLYIGMSADEDELDTAVTLDAAYTVFAFGSIGSGTGGANATNVRARVGTLANTSTGDTFDRTGLTTGDRATILVRLEEMADNGSVVSPFTVGYVTAGTKIVRAQVDLPLSFNRVTAGYPSTARRGLVSWMFFEMPFAVPGARFELGFNAVTTGKVTSKSAVALPITAQFLSEGTRIVTSGYGSGLYGAGQYGGGWQGAVDMPITITYVTEGVVAGGGVTEFGTASMPINFNAVTSGYAAVYIQTSTDSLDGAWTDQGGGTNLTAAIDEDVAADADYIRSELDPVFSACRIKLETGQDPNVSFGHSILWRVGKDATSGDQIDVAVTLYQGGGAAFGAGVVIASFLRTNVDPLTSYREVLSAGETDSITDYSDLYVEFEATVP